MGERVLRRTLIFGTVAFVLALVGGSVIPLSQVTTTRTAPVSDNVVAGKQVWEKHIC